ncbi:MAG: DnaB-like helicase N-terminal domain-containing protein, partial [Trueperaceae bacterium]|nr:DnaB-like helicase N-terminal domain-containing protein [Trueperaceae bacterium]
GDFYREKNGWIYDATLALHERREPIDFLTVCDELERREQLDVLEADLAAAGMPAPTRAAHAKRLLLAGYERFGTALGSLEATAGRVVAAAHRGDDEGAHAALADLVASYGELASPVLRPTEALLDTETIGLMDALSNAHPLRVQDAVVLVGQLEVVRGATAGTPPAAVQRGARTTTAVWAGPVRDVATLVLGLLALVPLFLLNLAFGGGNRNWQAIGVALLLLLIPALYEGVVGLGGVLATFAGIDALLPLAAYSVFSSAVAQTVWATSTLLAVSFTIAGLVGISRQFGLLGGRRAGGRAGRGAAGAGAANATTRTAGTTGTVDWDDDL